ncbi:unnamed protein product [Phyllotreta striolata]|uniref:Ion transport domain-containing protein n=1 Tax=Phyllotreta striolata TaxID=444603 RepID=A0A9P0DP61_PHYSR|nr:unnamed protein product [Phyllotreta striolata]
MYSRMDGSKAFSRTNSICPTPEEKLLELVLSNDTDEIEATATKKLLNHVYTADGNKTILLRACIEEQVEAGTIETLIKCGADVRYADDDKWEALHFAAKRTDPEVLKVIINGLNAANVNINSVLANGNNALHVLIRHGNAESEEFDDCVKLLIKEGINVNLGDLKGISPIFWAAKKDNKAAVKTILEWGSSVDIDSHKLRNESARDLIIKKNLYSGKLPNKNDNNNRSNSKDIIDTLYNYIKIHGEKDFKRFFDENSCEVNLCDDEQSEWTLLQLSVDKGCKQIVEYLVDKGADVTKTTKKEPRTPLEIAAEHGFHEIFAILLKKYDPNSIIPNSVLISLVQYFDCEPHPEAGIDRRKCCELLLAKNREKSIELDINGSDSSDKNAPLHYAVRYGNAKIVEDILGLGASLGSKNRWGIMPVQNIEPELLKKHLDDCVQFDVNDKKDKEEFAITFNYRTLIPPGLEKAGKSDPEAGTNEHLVHETEVIAYMSKAPEFKHLLAHPLIVTFLFMKWHRIRWLFYTNLAFYVAFFASLVTYIFCYFANFDEPTSFEKFMRYLSWSVLLVTFVALVLRESFQILVLSMKYVKNFENLIEIALIGLSGAILFADSPSIDVRKQISSVAILLAALELILMVGQHPKLSTNVVMLKTVSYNFFKFLLWYSLLIFAFAMSFYILFADKSDKDNKFDDPVFKTVVMLTGEFEASDIEFKFPVVGKLVFASFIFTIAIILVNLLNGLAVSDTQMIKQDAELIGHISRAQHIRYVEVLLLGDIVPSNFLDKIGGVFGCCFPSMSWSWSVFKSLARKVCLFPHLFDNYEITVLPNRAGQIRYLKNQKRQKCCLGGCQNIYLDKETVQKINEIVRNRKEQSISDRNISDRELRELLELALERLYNIKPSQIN